MNKRIIDIYREILDKIVKQKEITDLLTKSFFETQVLFNRLVGYNYLNYNFFNEEQAFMTTYFSYLVCREEKENLIDNIIEYIVKNEKYLNLNGTEVWNLRKGMEQYRDYPDNYTFKQNLLNMLLENKLKFLKTYKTKEILSLKKFI